MSTLYNNLLTIRNTFLSILNKSKEAWGIDYTGKPAANYVNMFSDIINLLDDSGNRTSFQREFANSGITIAPPVNTENSQYCDYMFAECSDLTAVPALNLKNVENVNSMFYSCASLEMVTFENFGKNESGIKATGIFNRCSSLHTVTGFDCTNVTTLNLAFTGCQSLKELFLNSTASCTNFDSTFRGCTALNTIEGLNLSSALSASSAFSGCTALQHITISGEINISISFADCIYLSHDSLIGIINALSPNTPCNVLYLGEENISKLNEEELSTITGRGWFYA